MINFKEWLQDEKKITSLQTIDSILGYIQSTALWVAKFNISKTSLLEINLSNKFMDIINQLKKNKIFIVKDNVSKGKYSKAIDFYLQYLKFVQLQQLNVTNTLNQSDGIGEGNDRKASDIVLDRTPVHIHEQIEYAQFQQQNEFCSPRQSEEIRECNDKRTPDIELSRMLYRQEQRFSAYLMNTKYFSGDTAKRYISQLNYVSDFCESNNISQTPLFTIIAEKEYYKITDTILSNRVFQQTNKGACNRYNAAISSYGKFLARYRKNNQPYESNSFEEMDAYKIKNKDSTSNEDILTKRSAKIELSVDICNSNPEYTNTRIDIDKNSSNDTYEEPYFISRSLKTVDEYIATNEIAVDYEQRLISTVLDNSFKNGIKLDSFINVKKFLMVFCRIYPNYELSDDMGILKEKIRCVTIKCLDDLYMTPNSIVKDVVLIKDILGFIIDTLKSGKKVIYLENVYNRFKNQLLDTNIYNINILESLIKHYIKDDVIYSKGAILSEYDAKLNIDDEVLEVLSGSDVPLSKLEIFEALHHISQSKIVQVLKSDKRSIYIQRNTYWHIDKFEVTEEDKLLLDDLIRYEIKDGFISLKKLLSQLNTQAPKFIEENNIVNHICLRDILKYYFADDFGFQYTFIGKRNEEMSGVAAIRFFLADKRAFKLSELFDFIDENDLPNHYELFTEEASNEFIRISEQEFIRKTAFVISEWDIKNVEEIIQKYLTNGYVAINKIDSFAIFPTIGFQWNSFLLESIIESYCYGYEVIDCSRSVTKPTGVIVNKRAGFKNYDEILVDVLAQQDKYYPLESGEDALGYLFNNGYIAQRRYKNFDMIFLLVKQKTQRIGS